MINLYDSVKTSTACYCHDCVQFGLTTHPKDKVLDDTVTATITPIEVYSVSSEAEQELERFIGTYESYGAWSNVKPCLSIVPNYPKDLLKEGA